LEAGQKNNKGKENKAMTTQVVQADIILQRMGNALADQAVLVDGAGKIFTALLAYNLQDNRIGWCEVFVQDQPGPMVDDPILHIETNVSQGMLKPDSVSMTPYGNDLHIRQSVHATWDAPGPGEIQPRIIALSEYVLVGVWTPLAAPPPTPYPMPCVPPLNRPYFDPNRVVTRAEIAKIVAVAAGLPDPPAGQQTFEDIPEGSTFWQWIEALAAAGAIGSFPCES
jgi:hypothetical protein